MILGTNERGIASGVPLTGNEMVFSVLEVKESEVEMTPKELSSNDVQSRSLCYFQRDKDMIKCIKTSIHKEYMPLKSHDETCAIFVLGTTEY